MFSPCKKAPFSRLLSRATKSLCRKMSIALFFLLIMLCSSAIYAQTTVTGTVKDRDGKALEGVVVSIKGNAITTVTDAQGVYNIYVPRAGDVLVFSFVGQESVERTVNGQSSLHVEMQPASISLDEVVVTGYSAQRKKDITGSVAVVDVKAMKTLPSGSAMQALQGQAAGVDVINSGVPGAASRIAVRGIGAFGSTQPLILIDGVQADINNVPADDVESMQVLKDAGAAAVYGVRGSNGVIVITTKKGKAGAPVFSYDAYWGTQLAHSGNPMNMLNTEDFARLHKIAFPSSVIFSNGIPDYMYGGPGGTGVGMEGDAVVDPSRYVLDFANPANSYLIQKVNKAGTIWFNEMFKSAPMMNHNITASGGSDKASYLFSAGYLDQQGVLVETFQKRYSARINTSYKIRNNIRVGENAFVMYKQAPGFANQAEFGPIASLYQVMPIVPMYDIMGNYGGNYAGPDLGASNPVASHILATQNRRANNWNVVGNLFAEINFLKHFTARTSFGGTIDNGYQQGFSHTLYFDKLLYNTPNSYAENAAYNGSSMWTNTLAYNNSFGLHQVSALAGSEAIKNYGRAVGGGSANFFSTDFAYLILSNGTMNVTNFSSAYVNSLFSVFGRADYNYDNRYLAGITIRRDGSSKFGSQKRYGVFPSFSVGWRISNEKFMKDISWLNDLKFRASYGILGSESNISPSNAFTLYGGSFAASYYDIAGSSNSIRQGFYQTTNANPLTGWEKNIVSNVGFDAALFSNKVNFSMEFFKKSVEGLLFPLPLPAFAGGASPPTVNIGDIQNVGMDIALGYRNKLGKDFEFSVTANVTSYKNKVVDIPGAGYFDAGVQQQVGAMVRHQIGHPVSSFFGYQSLGLFRDADDVAKSPAQPAAAPGRFKYADIDGDGAITPDDRTFIGNPNPDFTYGINIALSYRAFDLSTILYGSQGNDILNSLKINSHFFGTYVGGKSRDLLNAWTPENNTSNIPKVEAVNSFSTAGVLHSFFIEDGSYLRMRSASLGYTVEPKMLRSIGISKLRLYVMGTNLFTITKYSGLDPELVGSNINFGIDWGNYPNNFKSFFLGANLTF